MSVNGQKFIPTDNITLIISLNVCMFVHCYLSVELDYEEE